MARNVNVWIDGWRWTGQNVQTPQAAVNLRIEWTDNAGQAHQRIEEVKFPNILADMPVSWVKEQMEDLMLRALRVKAGVD